MTISFFVFFKNKKMKSKNVKFILYKLIKIDDFINLWYADLQSFNRKEVSNFGKD